jgi:hypothetical protein
MIRFRLNAEVQVKFDNEGTHSSRCHRTEQCRFRRVTYRVVMAIDHCADAPGWHGGSAALADDSLSQMKPKLVLNISAQPLVTALPLGRRSVAVLCAESCVIRS